MISASYCEAEITGINPEREFIETWAERKARRAAEQAGITPVRQFQPKGKKRHATVASGPVREQVLALYGVASKTVVAERFGLTPHQVNGIWGRAQVAGRLPRLFGRYDGGKSAHTQATRRNNRFQADLNEALARLDAPAARATGGEG